MTLADRLDALLTRPIYECDLETIREAAREIRTIRSERSELIEALEPFARYAKARTEKPLLGLGDIIHGIHVGTEWEASIKFSDCYSAWGILSKIKEQKA